MSYIFFGVDSARLEASNRRETAMSTSLFIGLGVIVFLVLAYIFAMRDLIRKSHALERRVDYSKLRPQPPDEDDY